MIGIPAQAQTVDLDILRDGQQARLEATELALRSPVALRELKIDDLRRAAGEEAKPTPDFKFKLTAPVFYNSNPDHASSGGSRTFEGNPDLLLKWTKMFGEAWQFTGAYDASIDRFGRSVSADGDSTLVKTRLQWLAHGHDQDLQPSLTFSETSNFAPTFAHSISSFHDLALGFDKMVNYDWKRHRLAPTALKTSSSTVWSLGLTGSVVRRIPDQGAPSRFILNAVPSLTYNLSIDKESPDGTAAQWSLSLSSLVSRRLYDSQGGNSRRDWYFQPNLTLTYVPPLDCFHGSDPLTQNDVATAYGLPNVQFQVVYSKLRSTVPAKEFQQWQVGPMLLLQWSF
ncbi:MAG TPA: hypothetical protein VHG32_16155 [Thermoanaerobaculia bacterium]|jgi:hypothetical protein|nr:hypothetical protein [Thermoanaerobaculia bacterium]